jgi:Cu(I)/Ag(I) efflux system membrane fusion protein
MKKPLIYGLALLSVGAAIGYGVARIQTVSSAPESSSDPIVMYWVAPMDPGYRRNAPGKSPMGMDLVPVYADSPEEPRILYWVAPMDPDYRREKPGKSPMGMDLIPVYENTDDGHSGISIQPGMINNLGVRTDQASTRPLWRKVEATGSIGFDETRISHIHLRTDGWIKSLNVSSAGDPVKKGDVLFTLYSPELINAQKEYLQASERGDQRLIRGAEDKLRALGLSEDNILELDTSRQVTEHLRFMAPQDGIVTQLNVREGMFVQPDLAIMSLANLDTVWLLADVFESQVDAVAIGQAAEARLRYLPGVVFNGQVDYVYPVLDPKTRTLRVRLKFENSEALLKPNMYARVSIFGTLQPQALTVPREALIRGAERDRVVIAREDGRFTVNEVLTGMESGDWIEILSGLEAGDEVVVSGQFLLDSEASLAGAIHRLESVPEKSEGLQPLRAFASGKIEAIEAARSRIRVSHGPIEDLGWPPMTMEFPVEDKVNLNDFSVGQFVQFTLRQRQAGEFVIEHAAVTRRSDSSMNPEHSHD